MKKAFVIFTFVWIFALIPLYRKYLIQGGQMKEDTIWFRQMWLFYCRNLHVWDTESVEWRGGCHRSMPEALSKGDLSLQTSLDLDGDGYTNVEEYLNRTNPIKKDLRYKSIYLGNTTEARGYRVTKMLPQMLNLPLSILKQYRFFVKI